MGKPGKPAGDARMARRKFFAAVKDGKDPMRGYEGCTGSDAEAAEVLMVTHLAKSDSKAGRRQVAARPGNVKTLGLRLREDIQKMEKFGFDVGIDAHNACLYILKAHNLARHCAYWLSQMKERFGVAPDVKSYNTCMAASVSTKEMDDVAVFFAEMKKAGVAPNDATYNVLLTAAPYEEAEAILKRKGRARVEDYNAIIKKAPSFQEAYRWVRAIKDGGFKVDQYTIGGLLKVCARAGDVESAEWVAELAGRSGVVLQTTGYTALLSVYAARGDYDGFVAVWKRMKAARMAPNKHTYLTRARLLKKCARRPKDFYMQKLEEFVDMSAELSAQIWTEVFLTHAKVGDVAGAIKAGYKMVSHRPERTPQLHAAYEAACKQPLVAKSTTPDSVDEVWVEKPSPYAERKLKPRDAARPETANQQAATFKTNRDAWRPSV